jgi:hypothetical protein
MCPSASTTSYPRIMLSFLEDTVVTGRVTRDDVDFHIGS